MTGWTSAARSALSETRSSAKPLFSGMDLRSTALLCVNSGLARKQEVEGVTSNSAPLETVVGSRHCWMLAKCWPPRKVCLLLLPASTQHAMVHIFECLGGG